MTEQEIELCLERFAACKATDVMNFDYAGTLAYIRRLKSENAELRARLDKAVELPFHPDDYHIELDFARLVVSTRIQGCKIAIPIYAYINCEDENSAEARFAELKGETE